MKTHIDCGSFFSLHSLIFSSKVHNVNKSCKKVALWDIIDVRNENKSENDFNR